MPLDKQIVIGMAGHIDHGKTKLVKSLTGKDTDSLKQEKDRGMTIDIGFAFLDKNITIIDVPGHEKFVKNMMSGASSIDIVILVIAADDGIMPQTIEHFEILKILDIFIELPIILPPIVAGVAMLMAFGRQGILGGTLEQLGITIPFTTAAVIFAQIFVSAPFYIRSARISFGAIDKDLEDLSRTLGKSPWHTFWNITIPLTWTGLTTGIALSWARSLSEFGATLMFAGNMIGETQTMPLGIMTAMETDLNTALNLSLVLLMISVIILLGIHFLSSKFSRTRV